MLVFFPIPLGNRIIPGLGWCRISSIHSIAREPLAGFWWDASQITDRNRANAMESQVAQGNPRTPNSKESQGPSRGLNDDWLPLLSELVSEIRLEWAGLV